MIEGKKNNFFLNEEVNTFLKIIIKNKSLTNGYIFYGAEGLGKKLRGLILDNNKNNKPSSLAELLLYSADRAEHVSKIISPALN